jgi:uncharacterized protein YecE (DUF72 family)
VRIHVGTSGWQYRDWRGRFYPAGLPVARWLEAYAAAFATVESNNAFYRLPERSVFEAWAARTPDDFRMTVKISRYLTHIRRLADPAEPVERFVERASGLGPKLAPVLLQLPPRFRADLGRLTETLECFPPSFRVAVEFRHPTWFTDDCRRVLERHGAALCLADRRGPISPLWPTTGWTYLRFHHGRARPGPSYGRQALASWVDRLAELDGVGEAFVYFNNDPGAAAPKDAARFAGLARRAGHDVTRTPSVRSIRVG